MRAPESQRALSRRQREDIHVVAPSELFDSEEPQEITTEQRGKVDALESGNRASRPGIGATARHESPWKHEAERVGRPPELTLERRSKGKEAPRPDARALEHADIDAAAGHRLCLTFAEDHAHETSRRDGDPQRSAGRRRGEVWKKAHLSGRMAAASCHAHRLPPALLDL